MSANRDVIIDGVRIARRDDLLSQIQSVIVRADVRILPAVAVSFF